MTRLMIAAAMICAGCGGTVDGYETETRAAPACGVANDAGSLDESAAIPEPSADPCATPPVGAYGCRSVLGWPENPCGLPPVDGGLVCCCE